MPTPKVSVLMPNYNCEKYLGEAIESILNQSFTDFEFIIIDDCSTDNSWEIIQDYAKTDERIVAVKNEENLGIGGNRNRLVNLAIAKYLVWQDSDDISIYDRIEKQYIYMESHEKIGICGGGIQFFNEKGDLSKRCYKEFDIDIRKTIFKYSPVALPGSIMLKSAVVNVGKFTKGLNVAEDLDLSFRVGRKYNFANVQEIVLKYRENGGSTTFKNLRQMELETIKIRWSNHKTPNYNMALGDKIYNIIQYLSIYLIPTRLKIALFNLFRNS